MKIAPLAEVKDRFSAYIDESRESPVVVTRNGRPAAIIVAIEDEDDLDAMLLVHNPALCSCWKKRGKGCMSAAASRSMSCAAGSPRLT